ANAPLRRTPRKNAGPPCATQPAPGSRGPAFTAARGPRATARTRRSLRPRFPLDHEPPAPSGGALRYAAFGCTGPSPPPPPPRRPFIPEPASPRRAPPPAPAAVGSQECTPKPRRQPSSSWQRTVGVAIISVHAAAVADFEIPGIRRRVVERQRVVD